MSKNDTGNTATKVAIEVLSENNIANLTEVIQDGIRAALDLNEDANIADSVDTIVTGVSPQSALDIVQHAADDAGISTDWNSDSFQRFTPNVESAKNRLDEDDFDSEAAYETRAFRNAADFRNMLLCEGTDDHNAADYFVLVTDDVTHDNVDELSAGAKGFLNSLRDNGRLNDAHVAYAGAPTDDAEADAQPEADSDAADEPSDAEVEDEFEELVA